MWIRCVAVLAVLFAFQSQTWAQYSTFRTALLVPNSAKTPTGITVGDFDEDGEIDVATSNSSDGSVTIFVPFFGQLSPEIQIEVGGVPDGILAGKFDTDDHLDLIVANGNTSISCLKGDGEANFTTPGESTEVGANPGALAAGDFNGDGKLDVAVANEGESDNAPGSVSVLLGRGDCTFDSVATLSAGTKTWAVAVGDLDHDGDDDILAINGRSNSGSVFLNAGNGTSFTLAGTFTTGQEPTGVALADLNGDGALDAAVAERNNDAVSVFLGDGEGGFTLRARHSVGTFPSAVAAGDLDGDGLVDIVVSNDLSGDVSVLLSDGAGGLAPARSYVAEGQPATLALADLDGDGTTDVVTANVVGVDGSVAVLNNRGGGVLHAVEDINASVGPAGLSIGDLDDDALPDLVVTNEGGIVLVLTATASGGFELAQSINVGGQPRRATLTDIDGDHRLDVAIIDNSADRIVLMKGNGDGSFGAMDDLSAAGGPTAIASGDFNDDGKRDLAATLFGPPGEVSVFLGNGNGTFGNPCYTAVGEAPVEIVARNIDALNGQPTDRKDDLVVVNEGSETVSVLKSINGCQFSTVTLDGLSAPKAVVVALFNSDMNPDIVVGNSVVSTQTPGIQLFTGNGNGTFTRGLTARSNRVDAMAVRDLTGDAIPDLALSDQTSNVVQVMRGRGNGGFLVESEAPVSRMPVSVASADFNGDGLYDAVTANNHVTANNLSLLTNCVGEPWCAEAPALPSKRGDGNGDDVVSAADLVAVAKEVSDGDGNQIEDIARAGYTSVGGVDANGDGRVDEQDGRAVSHRIFAGG